MTSDRILEKLLDSLSRFRQWHVRRYNVGVFEEIPIAMLLGMTRGINLYPGPWWQSLDILNHCSWCRYRLVRQVVLQGYWIQDPRDYPA